MAAGAFVDDPRQVAAAASPLRRRLLGMLGEPSSATRLAAELGLTRQRVNYHLRALEAAGLVELVGEQRRRGFVERLVRARPGLVVDPVLTDRDVDPAVREQDRFAAEHLVEVAAGTVRDVARMQAGAEATGKRLLTFTVEAELGFAEPADVHRFTDELTAALRELADRFDVPGGRRYRVLVGGHPGPAPVRGIEETGDRT
ncbi:ArsR/SmtB family transcription factor [Pseudonocardia pini]|uniref:ArsR/SmtB family transcription factor n=1 Tax=Pseudonocardia pini TaxID=2758030 RepID=UPI0015F1228F|nr:helix-turn-helix domain-containing protein [Pseudonocardia pini]